jgi:quercetin dioxygenase-like cupin family protein
LQSIALKTDKIIRSGAIKTIIITDISGIDYELLKQTIMQELFSKGKVLNLEEMVEYSSGGVISKQVLKNQSGNITLFSFDKGQGLTEHTAPFDAVVQVLDGEAQITIGGNPNLVRKGESIIMPANVSHALQAVEQFKMLLTMIKG